jgi:hypothetical protein
LLVHGYSEQFLNAYGTFPEALAATAPELKDQIVLSAFDSLDDGVTIDDLARGLEQQISSIENTRAGWNTADAAFFCHSTGALVVRRWIVNRLGNARQPLPTHLVTMAGANHGSSLAQLGRTPLGYVHQDIFKNSATVGARVLTDLDYGSEFLFRLNNDWLDWRYGDLAARDGRLKNMFVFSMGGDSLGNDKTVRAVWASSERGCDNTVRISGANLNYTILSGFPNQRSLGRKPRGQEAHLIVPGYSHYGPDTGIMASCRTPADPPMQAIRQALDVPAVTTYSAVLQDWADKCDTWAKSSATHPTLADENYDPQTNADVHVNSTIVFRLRDWGGRDISDCYIGLLDGTATDAEKDIGHDDLIERLLNISESILSHQPIHNNVALGSYSFYVNTAAFSAVHHLISITATEVGDCVPFNPVTYEYIPAGPLRLVAPNEVTYVDIQMWRDPSEAYALYDVVGRPSNEDAWRPFPDLGRIAPVTPAPAVAPSPAAPGPVPPKPAV